MSLHFKYDGLLTRPPSESVRLVVYVFLRLSAIFHCLPASVVALVPISFGNIDLEKHDFVILVFPSFHAQCLSLVPPDGAPLQPTKQVPTLAAPKRTRIMLTDRTHDRRVLGLMCMTEVGSCGANRISHRTMKPGPYRPISDTSHP